MRYSVVIILVAFSSLGYGRVPKVNPKSRIMGGHSVEITEYPYQVALLREGINYCGASLIRSNYILTAAHCVYDGRPGDFSVRAGSSIVNEGGIVVNVVEIHYHPDFSDSTYANDIAVLKLEQKLPVGTLRMKIIDLPEKDEPIPIGWYGAVTGWGRLSEGGEIPDKLQEVDLEIQPPSFCDEQLKPEKLDAGMFCAYTEEGKDTCQGDSGGPLVADGKQYGITSWGDECGKVDMPGVYTNVAYFRDFIDECLIEI